MLFLTERVKGGAWMYQQESHHFFTREDFQHALEEMIQPLRNEMIHSELAGLHLGSSGAVYDQKRADMEALIRVLWGLGPYWTMNQEDELRDVYIQKVSNGTDPDSPYYWGTVEDYDQYIVEMAALSLNLLLNKDSFWVEMSTTSQRNLVAWLAQALDKKIPKNNWTFFKVLIRLALAHCGEKLNREKLIEELTLIDTMAIENGWYVDGKPTQKDYYVPFAFHYYGLIFAKFMKEELPEWADKFIDRARRFTQEFIYFFDSAGEALPYGRSLTYRFAQGAFFSALIFAEVEAIPWGQIKTLLSNHLQTWLAHDIFTFDGRLSIGYHYENLVMAEGYNAPGSPYWAFKFFLLLATEPAHPFWQAEPESIVKKENQIVTAGNMFVVQAKNGQHVLGYPFGNLVHNQAHAEAKYSKFVYSTKFGFSVPKASSEYEAGAFDNVLAVSRDGQYYRVKGEVIDYHADNNCVSYLWRPFREVEIQTEIYPFGEWHVRVHEIKTTIPIEIREGGFSLPLKGKNIGGIIEPLSAKIISEELCSQIIAIEGYEKAKITQLEANTSLFFPRTSLPYLKNQLQPGTHRLICLVGGITGEGEKHAEN